MRMVPVVTCIFLAAACEGPPGAAGTPGAPGTNGISGYELQTISLPNLNIPQGLLPLPIPPCPSGKRVIGGGAEVSSANGQVHVTASLPSENGSTWRVVLLNNGPTVTHGAVTVNKICAAAS